jgi:hypothetical protein
MKKDDEFMESRIDEEEDLFDLSLDDLQPEDTIVEPHIEETDDEIIELIDLVQKGDFDLDDEDKESSMHSGNGRKPATDNADDFKIDEKLDLLDIPLDEELSFDDFEEEEHQEKGTGDSIVSGDDLKFFIGDEQPEAAAEAPADFLGEIEIESAFEEPVADKAGVLEGNQEIEDALLIDTHDMTPEEPAQTSEKTIRISMNEGQTPISLDDLEIDELEQPTDLSVEELKTEENIELQQEEVPEKQAAQPLPLAEEKSIGISEEKTEAILRKVVEEVMEKTAREIMTNAAEAAEKAAREMMTNTVEVMEKTARETMTNAAEAAEKATRETMANAIEVMEKTARETMSNVAEKIITDAIDVLKTSIESASD